VPMQARRRRLAGSDRQGGGLMECTCNLQLVCLCCLLIAIPNMSHVHVPHPPCGINEI
jgi:hypothetical protein